MSEFLSEQIERLHIVSRAQENFKKVGRQNYTPAKIRSRISSLDKTWNQCIQGHAVLMNAFSDQEKAKLDYFKRNKIEEYEEIYQTALDLMTEWLETLEPPVSPNRSILHENSFARSESTSLSIQIALKHLPTIKLPPFTGNFADWESFRDRFTALIIENKDLSNFSRMHFLASSLSGPALEAISSIPITANNFSVAWKELRNRFENKRKLIEIHISTLYNLPEMSRESAVELHSLRDKANRAISALRSLGRSSEEMLSDILTYFVTQKLDKSTRRAWKLKGSSDTEPPSFEDLNNFISARALALEELIPSTSKNSRIVKANSATAYDSSEPTCSLCHKNHYLGKCDTFLNKSPSQRREFVKITKRCFNCLGVRHAASECKSKFSCKTCQQRHHSLLHLDSNSFPDGANIHVASVNENYNQSTDDAIPSHTVTASTVSIKAKPAPVLLATAKVVVESPEGRKVTVRALCWTKVPRSHS